MEGKDFDGAGDLDNLDPESTLVAYDVPRDWRVENDG
jgi:hypothetical protein